MRRLTFALVLALAAGCSDGDSKKKDDPPQKSQAQAAQSKPQPKPQPAADASSGDDEKIVIHGSKRPDSSSAPSGETDAERQKRIERLKADAKASEGKDNGPTYRESTNTSGTLSKKEQIKARLAEIDAQGTKLNDEKQAMFHKGHSGRKGMVPDSYDNPERANAIDAEMQQLKTEKDILTRKLIEIDLAERSGPGPGGGGAPGGGGGAPGGSGDAPK
jgi:hypothetical protein